MLIEYLEDYYRAEATKRQEKPNNPFRASAMGRCIREGCYDLLGLKGAALQPRRIAVFKHGDNIHDVLTDDLRQALGWRFVEGMDFKDNFVEIDGAKISYHIDGAFQYAPKDLLLADFEKQTIGIVEIKSMSDFAFDRARKGEIDREYLAQAWCYYKGTDFNPVVFICYRKETSHMVEVIFDRQAPEKIVTQRLTGDPIELAKQDPLMVTEIRTPFDPSVESYVRERISWLKATQAAKDDTRHSLEENTELTRQLVPGADAVEDEVIKVQGASKAVIKTKELGIDMSAVVAERQRLNIKSPWYTLRTGRKILGFPCSFCGHKDRCYPNNKLEIQGEKPVWVV